VPEGAKLLGDGVDQRGMRVAERVDGDATQQVEVARALGVPDVGALPLVSTSFGGPKVFIRDAA
jgi:hypothetical protein